MIFHEVVILLLFDQVVPDFVVAIVEAIWRSERAVLVIVGEFAARPGHDDVALEFLDIPITNFALSLVVVDA